MDANALIMTVLMGAGAGWLAGQIIKGTGLGLLGIVVVGVLGAFVGAWLFGVLGVRVGSGLLASFIQGVVGAVTLLLGLRMIRSA